METISNHFEKAAEFFHHAADEYNPPDRERLENKAWEEFSLGLADISRKMNNKLLNHSEW